MDSARRKEYFYRAFPGDGHGGRMGPHSAPFHFQDYSTSNQKIGSRFRCHATQTFVPPNNQVVFGERRPAGESDRANHFFRTHGVRQHRTEPGYRDPMGIPHLTEHIGRYEFDQRVVPTKRISASVPPSARSETSLAAFNPADPNDPRFLTPRNYQTSHKLEFQQYPYPPARRHPAGKSDGKTYWPWEDPPFQVHNGQLQLVERKKQSARGFH